MALVVLLRGINVGGHRRFRPAALAEKLRAYDVVSLGAAGTFVVRRPGSREKFLAELRRKLPPGTEIACCEGSEFIRLEQENPFGSEASDPGLVKFVSVLSKTARGNAAFPIAIPDCGEWFVRILGGNRRLVFGEYRRHMKSIGCLGQIDRIFGATATTRSWKTILAVVRILNGAPTSPDRRARRSSSDA